MALEEKPVKNFLFIMCSQLRADHLGLYGHPSIDTPNITRLAQRGVTFTRAYTQSPLDTASHISAYTGRYVSTHGSDRDYSPIRISERTFGDYMRHLKRRSALIGKSCIRGDFATMRMLNINPNTSSGLIASEAGFESYDRLDGLHPGDSKNPLNVYPIKYNDFLRHNEYNSANPWQDFTASTKTDKKNSFFYENAHLPLGVHELESETNYLVKRTIDFFRDHGKEPWALHLSLTKPHWPYAASAPFHNLYNEEHIIAPTRSESEKENAHPIYQAFMQSAPAQTFADTQKRHHIMPAYMGLIKQIDEQLGGLFRMMDKSDMFRDTMIVLASDHGAYLGDHWLGDNELFHDPVVRVPLIVYDPRPEANGSRGIKSDELVELIDIVPTMLEAANIKTMPIHLEGRPLTPILHGKTPEKWRTAAFSEYNLAGTEMAKKLNIAAVDAKATMMVSKKWKYIHFRNYPAMMYDLVNDPHELRDVGREPGYERAISFCRNQMLEWALHHTSDTEPEAQEASVEALQKLGIYNGYWSQDDLPKDEVQEDATKDNNSPTE